MSARAFITGLSGPELSATERAFVSDWAPWGLIIFKRNVNEPGQLYRLIETFREAVGRAAPVLVDQEGGRVQRLGPPHWPVYPAGAVYGRLYDRDPALGLAAARLAGRLIAADLTAVGIDVDTLPLADVPVTGADDIVGDRAYGNTPEKVAAIAASIAAGLADGGVLPVLKHVPGHGRATADSHLSLPVVDADRETLDRSDFAAFRPLARLPMAMTAHVVYAAIDPAAPATASAVIVRDVIRNSIGFDGLLMSDDLSMGALAGTIGERATAAFSAGCDVVLHCNGNMDEMREVAAVAPVLAAEAARRAEAAMAARKAPAAFDVVAGREQFSAMMPGLAPRNAGMAVS